MTTVLTLQDGIDFINNALSTFSSLSEGKTAIDRDAFVSNMEKVWKEAHVSPKVSEDELALDFSALFDAYDTDGDGVVNLVEFLNGLALLTSSSIEEKANCVYNLW